MNKKVDIVLLGVAPLPTLSSSLMEDLSKHIKDQPIILGMSLLPPMPLLSCSSRSRSFLSQSDQGDIMEAIQNIIVVGDTKSLTFVSSAK